MCSYSPRVSCALRNRVSTYDAVRADADVTVFATAPEEEDSRERLRWKSAGGLVQCALSDVRGLVMSDVVAMTLRAETRSQERCPQSATQKQ